MRRLHSSISVAVERLLSYAKNLAAGRKRLFKRAAAVVLVLILMFSLTADLIRFLPSAYAAQSEDQSEGGLCERSLELYPNGEGADRVITLGGMMPKDATAEATDVTLLRENSDDADMLVSTSVLVAYDISITDGGDEFQPVEDHPIYVEISDPVIPAEGNIELRHVRDDGTLDDYKSDDFAAAHSDIILDTLTERRVYRVFAAFESKVFEEPTDAFVYYDAVGDHTKAEYESIVQSIKDMSCIRIWNEPAHPRQILFLSTCSYHTEQGRFVVAAYRVN